MLLSESMNTSRTNDHQIHNQLTHQTILNNNQCPSFDSSAHPRCLSQELAKYRSQQNRNPLLILQSRMKTVSSFHTKLPTAFSRPYLALDNDMAQLNKHPKILSIREVKEISGRQSQQGRSLAKKRGISLVKESRLKNDQKIGRIELGGKTADRNLTKGKERLYV